MVDPSHTVLISDSQYLTAQGLKLIIDNLSGFKYTRTVAVSADLIDEIKDSKPSILLIDTTIETAKALQILQQIKTQAVQILAIANPDNRLVKTLLEIGVKGLITKSCSEIEITNALISVSSNQRFICPQLLDIALNLGDHTRSDSPLSSRELEVLKLIALGNTSQEIAEKLFLSVHTINSHRKNILKKLNLSSPMQLIIYALQEGIIKN